MHRVPLQSSLLAWVDYDPDRRLLEVEFRTGDQYRFFDVPPHCFEALLQAPSKGRYFNSSVRNRFPYQNLSRPASVVVLSAIKN